MAQAASRQQMSAVREQHAMHPHRPKPASKPGVPATANVARGKSQAPPRGDDASDDSGGTPGSGGADSGRAKRDGDSGNGLGEHLADLGGKALALPGKPELSLPTPHLSMVSRLALKLLKRLAKHELRKLAKAAGKGLESAPGALAKPNLLEKPREALEKPREVLEKPREALAKSREALGVTGLKPTLPIQASVDIAVPLSFAWQRWMELSFLPEGVDRVVEIERDGAELSGRLEGGNEWVAKILDERECESFAWQSSEGSDCAGLMTFHRLGDRLTRLELTLDVLPQSIADSASLLLHVADWRARRAMRRFKADLEVVSPDVYADDANPHSDNDQGG